MHAFTPSVWAALCARRYAKVSSDWWEVGTDSALAAHPVVKGATTSDGSLDVAKI